MSSVRGRMHGFNISNGKMEMNINNDYAKNTLETSPKFSMTDCTLCPRNCHADRTQSKFGVCGVGNEPVIARAALHMWEEPCISGTEGSGTVFFSGCNLACIFCQNYSIAHTKTGKTISTNRLSEIFLELQEKKANNINLVTPTHFVPQIANALISAKKNGLSIPVIYNSGGYESVETLQMLEGMIDVYLPDLKYYSSALSSKYSHVADYFEKASLAIAEMVRQTGEPLFRTINGTILTADQYDDKALICKGTIVRHLLLPGCLKDSKAVIKYLYETYGNRIYISIMNQYTPLKQVADIPELNHKVSSDDYEALVDYAISLGVENGFIQEGDVAAESFIPDFDGSGI